MREAPCADFDCDEIKCVIRFCRSCMLPLMQKPWQANSTTKIFWYSCLCFTDHWPCAWSWKRISSFFLVLVQVPRVFIGEECIGGGSDVAALQRSGKLEGMLKSIGALQWFTWRSPGMAWTLRMQLSFTLKYSTQPVTNARYNNNRL